jgi:hypothetical protein
MKNIKIFIAVLFAVALIAACGGRRDNCPSVGKTNTNQSTFIA